MVTSNIPFLFINITVLSCFLLMFVTFLATKKTREIWAFLAVLLDCILWSGGSVLMRLEMWPGLNFWYAVSLVALFSMELLFYTFVHTFSKRKGKFLLILFAVWTAATIPGTISGFYLTAPVPTILENGAKVFIYNINWHIIIPCVMFVAIIAATCVMLLQVLKEQGVHAPGIQVIITSGFIMLVGNLLQVSLPGNTFPFDALAGVIFAVMLMYALYKRRMFRLTLVVSRTLLTLVLAVICLVGAANFITPMQKFAQNQLGLGSEFATMIVAVAFAAVLGISYTLVRRLLDAMFTREEHQNRLIKTFSAEVSQSLSTADIMEKMGASLI